jgi:hypothetical protein
MSTIPDDLHANHGGGCDLIYVGGEERISNPSNPQEKSILSCA